MAPVNHDKLIEYNYFQENNAQLNINKTKEINPKMKKYYTLKNSAKTLNAMQHDKDYFIKNMTYCDMTTLTASEILIYDHRTFLRYAWDLILNKHIIFYTFFLNSIIKPRSIRIVLFFLTLSLLFAMNAIFYTDQYIEQRNIDVQIYQTVKIIR